MEDGRWEMEDGRWEMGDGRWEMPSIEQYVFKKSERILACCCEATAP